MIYAALLGTGGLLTRATVSVWPRYSHILLKVMPLIPRLMMQRGIMTPLLLVLLTMQILTWPALWIILTWLSIAIIRHRRKRRHTTYRTAWQRERYEVEMEMQGIHAQVTDEIPAVMMPAWQPQGSLSWMFRTGNLGPEKPESDAALIPHFGSPSPFPLKDAHPYFQEWESPFWTYAPESL